MAATAGASEAGDRPDHDAKVARAAAERVAAKLGDLRGGLAHDAGLADLILKDRIRTGGTQALPAVPKPRTTLPPMVMSAPPPGVDTTMTGSALPAGVDPMITGANR